MMCEGLTDAQIARALFISPLTVRNHVQAVFRTLGCRSRAAAVAVGYRGGV
ncbi:MAG: helix-turn-helix transcriptional regulator [Thermoleophilia bacterium]